MQAKPDCIPCSLRQVETIARRVTADEETVARLRRLAEERLAELGLAPSPAELATELFHLATAELATPDPFASEKERYNREAVSLYPRLRKLIEESPDRLQTALLLAVAGNLLDLGIMNPMAVEEVLKRVLSSGLARDDGAEFRRDLARAGRLLYLADNAGEIAFDRLLVEEIRRFRPGIRVTVAVKSGPASSDATRADAEAVGLLEVAEVIETGGASLGVPRSYTSPAFWEAFYRADLVLVKGHANFETTDEEDHPALYFLLTAKCPIVAGALGVRVGDAVLARAKSR
ncbi:MAG: damage-control phosphatase ARMT1 family protein [Bacillota bacterium]